MKIYSLLGLAMMTLSLNCHAAQTIQGKLMQIGDAFELQDSSGPTIYDLKYITGSNCATAGRFYRLEQAVGAFVELIGEPEPSLGEVAPNHEAFALGYFDDGRDIIVLEPAPECGNYNGVCNHISE